MQDTPILVSLQDTRQLGGTTGGGALLTTGYFLKSLRDANSQIPSGIHYQLSDNLREFST
jgi:hypothetical protein